MDKHLQKGCMHLIGHHFVPDYIPNVYMQAIRYAQL